MCAKSEPCVFEQAHERLEEVKLQAVQSDNVQLIEDILQSLTSLQGKDEAVAELAKILQEPNFKVSQQPPLALRTHGPQCCDSDGCLGETWATV